MAAPALLYAPRVFFIDANGDPLSGGKLFTYEPGTSTDKTTYFDQAFTTPHANPIILDANGSAVVWLDGAYKFDLTDSNDVQIDNYPVDNYSTAPSAADTTPNNAEWVTTGDTATFIDTTNFSVPNDNTITYQVGRRVRATVTAGTLYGRISASSFASSITTVTVVLDSGNLDSGLSIVDVGVLSVTNPSIPIISDATIGTQAAAAQQVSSGELIYAVDTGAADVYVMTLAPAITAYTTGMEIVTKIANANLTTTPTINANALGAKTIKRENGGALLAGDLPVGYVAHFKYDGTDMTLLNPALVKNHDHSDITEGGSTGIGILIQIVHTADGAVATGTTQLPLDDTIPQNTEGDEYMTLAITPTDASNKLVIEMGWYGSSSSGDNNILAALFQDSTADALATGWGGNEGSSGQLTHVPIKYEMVAGTTSSTTFKIRAGTVSAGTTTFNGAGAARFFGGTVASFIRITEYKV